MKKVKGELYGITKDTHKEEVITEWCAIHGLADCYIVTIKNESLKMSLNVFMGSMENFASFIKDRFDKDVECKSYNALFIAFKDRDFLQWNWINIQSNSWLASDYGLICHELHHYIHVSLPERDIKYCEENEEVFAHLQGWFMEMVVRAFAQLKKIQKKK